MSDQKDVVEIIAQAMWNAADQRVGSHVPWGEWAPDNPKEAEDWRFLARAAYSALTDEYTITRGSHGVRHRQEPFESK
jgi:hypothetical protein